METPGKSTVIEFVYNADPHCIYYVPEGYQDLVTEAQDKFDVMEVIKFQYSDFDGDRQDIKTDPDLTKVLKYCDKNGIVLLKLYVITAENADDVPTEPEISFNRIDRAQSSENIGKFLVCPNMLKYRNWKRCEGK